MEALKTYVLGEIDESLSISGRQQCADTAAVMSQQARRSFHIFSQDLDPPLFNNSVFIDSVRHVIATEPHAEVRILLYDVDSVLQKGHRLMQLKKRASSHIQIRQLPQAYHHAFFIVDKCGVIDRKKATRYDGIANFNAPGWASDLVSFFDDVWNRSVTTAELSNF